MEASEVRDFFESLPPSEQRRLLVLFYEMMLVPEPVQERDWSDKTGDGMLKSSPPIHWPFSQAARNGK